MGKNVLQYDYTCSTVDSRMALLDVGSQSFDPNKKLHPNL